MRGDFAAAHVWRARRQRHRGREPRRGRRERPHLRQAGRRGHLHRQRHLGALHAGRRRGIRDQDVRLGRGRFSPRCAASRPRASVRAAMTTPAASASHACGSGLPSRDTEVRHAVLGRGARVWRRRAGARHRRAEGLMADGAADELEILFPTSRRPSPIRTAAPISVAFREFRSRGAARLIVEALAAIAPDALDGETPRPAARGNGRMRRGRAGAAGGGRPAGIRSGSDGFPPPPPFPWRCGRRTALFLSASRWRRSRAEKPGPAVPLARVLHALVRYGYGTGRADLAEHLTWRQIELFWRTVTGEEG